MKIIYSLVIIISFNTSIGFANTIKSSNSKNNICINPNQTESSLNVALVELIEGINPKAFNKTWKTEGPAWIEKVKGANDVATLSSAYLTLAETIKPKYFKPTWEKSKEKWIKQVKEARSNLALAGLLKSFYNNLLPETFTKDWPSKGAQWLETLNKIE